MLDGNTEYRVDYDHPIEYVSMYGYKKRRFRVLTASGSCAAEIKEERTPGLPGQPEIVVFYTRSDIKKYGQLRFYQSPEALIVACGGKLYDPKAHKNQPKASHNAASKPDKFATRDEMIEWYAANLGIQVKSLKSRMANEGYGARTFTERDIKKVFKAKLTALNSPVALAA